MSGLSTRITVSPDVGEGARAFRSAFLGGSERPLPGPTDGVPIGGTWPVASQRDRARCGSDQVLHYIKNLQKSLGYLLIFDARARDFGKGIDPVTAIANFIVVTNFIDVRPSLR